MSSRDDDLFANDEAEVDDEFDGLTERLFAHISEFADDENVPDGLLPALLLRLSLTTRMMAYATSVAKPSAGGLKLDLDRFRRDVDDIIRETKKDAEAFVARAKEAIAAESELDDEGL